VGKARWAKRSRIRAGQARAHEPATQGCPLRAQSESRMFLWCPSACQLCCDETNQFSLNDICTPFCLVLHSIDLQDQSVSLSHSCAFSEPFFPSHPDPPTPTSTSTPTPLIPLYNESAVNQTPTTSISSIPFSHSLSGLFWPAWMSIRS